MSEVSRPAAEAAFAFRNIKLHRPLAVFDLETTGTNVQAARIVQISVLKLAPAGSAEHWTRRINPCIPIPAGASAVHGITDADVAGEPRFARIAPDLLAFLDGCDLSGFNIRRFDVPLLQAEFRRAGLALLVAGRAIVDAMEIYHAYERRDLAAAVRFYCGREHAGHHSADRDVVASAEVLDAMIARYADLPRNIRGLARHLSPPDAIDAAGRFVNVNGQPRFRFGRFAGQLLEQVAATHPEYLRWMLSQDFLDDAKALVQDALKRAACATRSGAAPE